MPEPPTIAIAFTPVPSYESTPRETHSSGRLPTTADSQCLTRLVNDNKPELPPREGHYIASCDLAYWLAYNFHRLTHEPKRTESQPTTCDWSMTHRMAAIGSGYIWPFISTYAHPNTQHESQPTNPGMRRNPLPRLPRTSHHVHRAMAESRSRLRRTGPENPRRQWPNQHTELHELWSQVQQDLRIRTSCATASPET